MCSYAPAYLGLKLTPTGLTGKFTLAMKTIADKAIQALFAIKKIYFSNLKPKLQIKFLKAYYHPFFYIIPKYGVHSLVSMKISINGTKLQYRKSI
jgi:hypothetical protein